MKRTWPCMVLAALLLAVLLARPAFPPAARARAPQDETELPEPERPRDFSIVEATAPPPRTGGVLCEGGEEHCLPSLFWLLHHQNLDGSWGEGGTLIDGVLIDKPGITGVALLSLLGAGYTHLSKDTYGGLCMGDAVRRGLQRLMADQRDDGMFRSARGGLDHALAALALSEAYGLTGSDRYKAKAQAAADALVRLQIQEGSWGEEPATAWAALGLKSAELAGLDLDASAVDRLRGHYDRRASPDAAEMLARIILFKDRSQPVVAAPPDPSLHRLHFQAMALFQYDGPSGDVWRSWNQGFKTAVFSRQGPDGCWPGADRSATVVNTSLASLCLEVYYRYANVLGSK